MNYSCIDFKTNVGNLGNDKIVLLILNKADVYATKVHISRCRFAAKLAVFS